LETRALPLDAVHKDGVMELDLHSLYGTQETMATNNWFKQKNKRAMIIERSSYAGSGKFGSMWLGDNYSKP
jgi:alpha-glucosidase (family GH31 glycosyl hydrolase)